MSELSSEEMDFLQELFDNVDGDDSKLNNWEKDFIADNKKRWEEYQEGTRISVKQWAKLRQVAEHFEENDKAPDLDDEIPF